MKTPLKRMPVIWAICATILGLGGCSKSFMAREYPSFYDPNLRTVAVVPFQNETSAHGAGILAADNLAAALRANGTYRVIPPRRLQSLLAREKLPNLSLTDQAQNAEILRQVEGIQAFIMGTVLRDSAITSFYPSQPYYYYPYYPAEYVPTDRVRSELVEEEEEGEDEGDVEGFGDDFGDDFDYDFGPYPPDWYWGYPYYYYPEYSARAHVSMEVSMVRVSDGAVLFSTPVPVQGRADLTSRRRILPTSATLDAMHRATTKLVKDLAVVPVKVKVNPRADLRTATGEAEGRWMYNNTFSRDDEKIYVVMHLPLKVGRDAFRLTVAPKGHPNEIVVTKDFHWPADRTTDAITISPREIVARTGPGDYTVSFHAMGESVMHHNFKIK